MKRILLLAIVLVALPAPAQTALSPPTPALTPVTPDSLALPAATNALALTPGFTNTTVTAVTVQELAPLLTNLENTIVQTLPVLTAFNDEFAFFNILSGGQQPLNNPGPVSVPVVPVISAASLNTVSSGVAPVLVGTNVFVLPPGLAGPGTTNGLLTFVLTRDTLRALLILQNDMERMLPVLDAVNGGTNFINAAAIAGSLTAGSTNAGAGTSR